MTFEEGTATIDGVILLDRRAHPLSSGSFPVQDRARGKSVGQQAVETVESSTPTTRDAPEVVVPKDDSSKMWRQEMFDKVNAHAPRTSA